MRVALCWREGPAVPTLLRKPRHARVVITREPTVGHSRCD